MAQGLGDAAQAACGQPLPENVKSMLETRWNVDLSKVRVHLDSSADGISRKLNAKALTTGNDIFFRAGTWNPTSLEGLQLIAHETWHTQQQANNLVQKGIDQSASLELEAQSKGNQLSSQDVQALSSGTGLKTKGISNHTPNPSATLTASRAVQRDKTKQVSTPTVSDAEIKRWTRERKLLESIKRAPMAESLKQQLLNAVSLQSLGLFGLVFGLGIVAQATPVGWAADLIIAGLVAFGVYSLGTVIFDVIKDFGAFAGDAVNARSECELNSAGAHFADAVAKIGVNAIIALLAHVAAKGVSAKLKANSAARQPVTPKQIQVKVDAAQAGRSPSSVGNAEAVSGAKPKAPQQPGLETRGYQPKPGERGQTKAEYQAERSQARAQGYKYDPKTRTDGQLAKDTNPTSRANETPAQAQARVRAALIEVARRAILNLLGVKPPKINLAQNDANFRGAGAHTLDRHGWQLTLQDLMDRVLGQGRWTKRENFSYKWVDESTANRIVNEYIQEHWEAIRQAIAQSGRYEDFWNSGNKTGEGYYNENYMSQQSGASTTALPPKPVFGETSWVKLRLEFDKNTKQIFIVTAFPMGKF